MADTEMTAALRALFEGAPVGLAIWDAELRYRQVNPRLAEINGVAVDAHAGRTPAELLGELGSRAEECIRKVLASGAPATDVPFTGQTPAAPGVQRHWQASFFPVGEGVGGVVIEVTTEVEARREAETARAAADVLARVGPSLGASMRPDRVLDELLRVAVPALADSCTIHLARGDGGLEPAAGEHLGELDAAVSEVARTGRRRVFADAVVLPLYARGAVLGVLTLTMGASGRHYDDPLVELTAGLAAGAGLALDNARLFAEQREVARALQHTLLPARLPEVPGAELSARYRAAGRSIEAGGDFYDVFPDGGEWAFVIGDVVGKGAEAAALTALVRATIQAAVLRGDDAEAALRLADEALRRRSPDEFCSAVHGRIRSAGRLEIELLVAGHPPPLVLRAGGALEEIEASGTLLGVARDPAFGAARLRLEPGDALLLYTDGAIELRGDDRFRGERALRETVRGMAGQPLERIAEAIEREALVLGGGELRDDLAVLAIGAVRTAGQ